MKDTITVAGWNILADEKYPQAERINGVLETITQSSREARLFDVVGLTEVAGEDNGQRIARGVYGYDGVFAPHSRKKLDEHIGMAWSRSVIMHDVEATDLGHNKKAIIGMLGDVAIATIHLKRQKKAFPSSGEQESQMSMLLERLDDVDRAIILGDFNCLAVQKPRRMLRAAGFESAFPRLVRPHNRTHPMPGYEDVVSESRRRALRLAGGRVSLDGIYQKGLETIDYGIAAGPSDHALVWAKFFSPKI